MATYTPANKDLRCLLDAILAKYYPDLILNGITIDLLWAHGERDEKTGELTSPAITKTGVRAYGLCRKTSLKERAAGRADVEITLDHDFWDEEASQETQVALLDHELYHIELCDETDDLGRPKIAMRKHDHEFGWFNQVALRHGEHSVERMQAKYLFDSSGQAYWPDLFTEKALGAVAV